MVGKHRMQGHKHDRYQINNESVGSVMFNQASTYIYQTSKLVIPQWTVHSLRLYLYT